MARNRDWTKARKPVQPHQVAEPMLARIRRAADKSWLPQTVWPSEYYGPDFLGVDCLLVSAATHFGMTPEHAAKGAEPLLTILPTRYFEGWVPCTVCNGYKVNGEEIYGPMNDGEYYHMSCWNAQQATA